MSTLLKFSPGYPHTLVDTSGREVWSIIPAPWGDLSQGMCYRRECPSLLTPLLWALDMIISIQKKVTNCDDAALWGGEDAPG